MRRIGGLVTALLALALLAAGPAATATAANEFASDPAQHAELKRAPGWVTMAFDFALDPSTAKMLVLNSAGENVTTGELAVEWTNVRVQLREDLPKDTYTVHYRVSRADGEPLGGTFQFAYGKGNWTSDGDTTWKGSDKEPDVMKNPDPNATTAAADPSATPTETPSVTPSATPTPTPSATPTPSVTASPVPAADGGSGLLGWAIGAGVVVVLAAAGGAWWYRSRHNADA